MMFSFHSSALMIVSLTLLTSWQRFEVRAAEAPIIVPIGSEINGRAVGGQSGYSLSISADGTRFVVGAPYSSSSNGTNAGQVNVYQLNATLQSYETLGFDLTGTAATDLFGYAVSLSADGTTLVVGAPFHDGSSATNAGQVSVYKYNKNVNRFTPFGSDIKGNVASEQFGLSLSISGDGMTFVVGALEVVRVYRFNVSSNVYLQVGSDIKSGSSFSFFGWSVSMSSDGSIFVVGAPNFPGTVRVYKFNQTVDAYSQLGSGINGESALDGLGISVSMSADGSRFVAGAVSSSNAAPGSVLAFQFNSNSGNYIKMGQTISGEAGGDQFGHAVSLSADGEKFVVGAIGNDVSNSVRDSGHARVHQWNTSSENYSQIGLDIEGEAENDAFGYSVSISADGLTFIVGAPYNDANNSFTDSGLVRAFKIQVPTKQPTIAPTRVPTIRPTTYPSEAPTQHPTIAPTKIPTKAPTKLPTKAPTKLPTKTPTKLPTKTPTKLPTKAPTKMLTNATTMVPSAAPVKPISTPVKSPIYCGSFRWIYFFCPRRGQCGYIQKLLCPCCK